MGEAIREGRYRASFPDGTVVFLIGMRINRWRAVRWWWPVFMAMPKMLRELGGSPELGLLGTRTAMGGRTVTVVQYWRSMDALMAYARAAESEHLPAWKAFNQRVRKAGGSIGIWHEAHAVNEATSHTVYSMMPEFGMAKALKSVPLSGRMRSGDSEKAAVGDAVDRAKECSGDEGVTWRKDDGDDAGVGGGQQEVASDRA